MNTQPFLSGVLIVKNESANIKRCVDSLRKHVDELILVDTGSSDDTREIARSLGCTVSTFQWCNDFSAARNYALSQATGRWIIQLDADETLVETEAFLESLKEADHNGIEWCSVQLFNLSSMETSLGDVVSGRGYTGNPQFLPRAARRILLDGTPLQYHNPVHETFSDCIAGKRHALLKGKILHYGAAQPTSQRTGKYIPHLERWMAAEPENTSPYGYLAHEYLQLGDARRVAFICREGWRHVHSSPSTRSIFRLASLYGTVLVQQGDWRRLRRVLDFTFKREGGSPDIYYLYHVLFVALLRPDLALKALNAARQCWNHPVIASFIQDAQPAILDALLADLSQAMNTSNLESP